MGKCWSICFRFRVLAWIIISTIITSDLFSILALVPIIYKIINVYIYIYLEKLYIHMLLIYINSKSLNMMLGSPFLKATFRCRFWFWVGFIAYRDMLTLAHKLVVQYRHASKKLRVRNLHISRQASTQSCKKE